MESPTLRHQNVHDEWVPAANTDVAAAEAIDAHIAEHFGPVAFVWHEMASHLVHVDVNVVEPTPERPYFTLVTSGMSDLPMTTPEGADVPRFAELMLMLPEDWSFPGKVLTDDDAYWPVRLLKMAARLPHEYGTWLGEWHTIPNGDPAVPYVSGIPFSAVVITPMVRRRAPARRIVLDDNKEIALLALIPIYTDELTLKLTQGTRALIKAFDQARVTELFDPDRASSAGIR